MTGRLLDVTTLPSERIYSGATPINLATFVDSHYDAIQALAAANLVKTTESFGFAMFAPLRGDEINVLRTAGLWDDPERFVWFVHGWGPDRDRYIANAVRKLRPLLRQAQLHYPRLPYYIQSTLNMRFKSPRLFQDAVESQNSDGTFAWGDFPWGGAVDVLTDGLTLIGAISGLTQYEDDFMTKLILGGLAQRILTVED